MNCPHVEASVFIPNGAMDLGVWYGATCKTCQAQLEARVTTTGQIELRDDPKVVRKSFKLIHCEGVSK